MKVRHNRKPKKVFDEDNSPKLQLDMIEINGKFLSRQLGKKSVVRSKYNVKRSVCWGTAQKKATEKKGLVTLSWCWSLRVSVTPRAMPVGT